MQQITVIELRVFGSVNKLQVNHTISRNWHRSTVGHCSHCVNDEKVWPQTRGVKKHMVDRCVNTNIS